MADQQAPTELYRSRTAFWAPVYVGVAAALGFFLMLFSGQGETRAEDLPWAILVAGLIVVLYAIFWSLPIVGEGRRIVVDATGLRAGRSHLPAKRIGSIEVAPAEAALRAMWTYRVGEHRLRPTRMFMGGVRREGVLIMDLDGGDRPYWLVEAKDPQVLVAALNQAKSHANS